jgi:hypothetical protein
MVTRADLTCGVIPPVIVFPPAIIVAPAPLEDIDEGLTNLYGFIVLVNAIRDFAYPVLAFAVLDTFVFDLLDDQVIYSHSSLFPMEPYFPNQNKTTYDNASKQS